jgi:F0F1-type ATP synthase epsilon subunit
MSAKPAAKELLVSARAPFHIYYEGPALVVSAANNVGKFDILPGHADFFSIINPGEVVIETNADNVVNIPISGGIIGVRNDRVLLFVNM